MSTNEFNLKYTENAEDGLKDLIHDKSKKVALKAVVKSLKSFLDHLYILHRIHPLSHELDN